MSVCVQSVGCFFFFKQKTAYEMQRGLVGSEMCIRDSLCGEQKKIEQLSAEIVELKSQIPSPDLQTVCETKNKTIEELTTAMQNQDKVLGEMTEDNNLSLIHI
eukprot:TRINITY_DN33047_c0_g1_i1.p2 TRINITY_DN33047_c0_g1~~TRINITY_DN33047_c0_g1_i1.p2  ORF type:complete len:103 (+),score=36.09 TRINITY_DN33047_c0_g1_i1:87-395(+)